MDPVQQNFHPMSNEQHLLRHQELYECLEELVADWAVNTEKSVGDATILDLVSWARRQADDPNKLKWATLTDVR